MVKCIAELLFGDDMTVPCGAPAVLVEANDDGTWGLPRCGACMELYKRETYRLYGAIVTTAALDHPGIVLSPLVCGVG